MRNLSFNYRGALTALALTVLALAQSLQPATSARALPAADLTTEKQALTSFTDGLNGLEKKVVELQRQTSITAAELNTVKTNASSLKTKISQTQQAFQSVIRKLKATGEWEKYDAYIEQEYADSTLLLLIKEEGGARRLLEILAGQMGSLSTDIDALVQPLNAKVAAASPAFESRARFGFLSARAAGRPAATATPAVLKTMRCYLRLTGFVILGGAERAFRAGCACQNADRQDRKDCEALSPS